MAKPPLYFVTTRNCNLKCRHCYLEAGPGKLDTTISPEDFKTAIGNLPKESLGLILTGGEIFTIQDNLFSYLETIKQENIERKYHNLDKIKIGIQTNGFWASKGKKRVKAVLDDLANFEIYSLDISSDDRFHREQGISTEYLRALKNQAKASRAFESVQLRGGSSSAAMPIGRAKEMELKTEPLNYAYACKNFLDECSYTIREDGQVYVCCFGLHPLPGNIIEESFDSIIEKTKKDERLNVLNYEGIEKLAVYDGWKECDVKTLVETYGKCGLCARLYAP